MEENLRQETTAVIKIALYGPESSGKTTLAKQLAAHFKTIWIPEFARDFLQQKWDDTQTTCASEDLIPIMYGQIQLENEGVVRANELLFADTTLMTTKVFSEIYYSHCDPLLDATAIAHTYDLYLLTDIDVPWEKDDLRDRPNERQFLFNRYKEALISNNKPYITISGTIEERLEKGITIVTELLKAKSMGFTSEDYVAIYNHGIPVSNIEKQFEAYRHGLRRIALIRPATLQDGITPLTQEDAKKMALSFDTRKDDFRLKKFIPASGAASRMFKFLSEFLVEYNPQRESINAYINRKKDKELQVFLIGKEKLPFYKRIIKVARERYADQKLWSKDLESYYFIKTMLDDSAFDYANKPKGILPFHHYDDHIASPLEEHLHESFFYANSNGVAQLHFTITEKHQEGFEKIISEVKSKIENESGIRLEVHFSYQHNATDTIAVTSDNKPYRDQKGQLVFRPGGHGALIENLNTLQSDIIFIKNIDNVIHNHVAIIARYKKALAGILIELQSQIFTFLRELDSALFAEKIDQILEFCNLELSIGLVEDVEALSNLEKVQYLQKILNRPIRVCGMVKNEGEPGGGPFWIASEDGSVSLQIVESSQVDSHDTEQMAIFAQASHFNPVDLVCGIRDYQGEMFDLKAFVDDGSGFIVHKTKDGRNIKAYELPGLWNGAMANWITVFVEVPIITFNPVKTVNDLLKPAHQPE